MADVQKMELSWKAVQMDRRILKAIKEFGFKKMTPVQATTIPLFSSNKDVAVEAVTGSGKTLAFLIPVLEMLLRKKESLGKFQVGAVIISPTRELATQIFQVVESILKHIPEFKALLFTGGYNPCLDMENFKTTGAHIIVATPGRIVDLFERKTDDFNFAGNVKSLEVLVLDEADRLLDMGFEKSLNTLLSYLPKQRRTGLFSATQTKEVEDLMRAGLRNPVCVNVKEKGVSEGEDKRTPSALENFYLITEADEKMNTLVAFLRNHANEKILVFFSSCACVDYFSIVISQLLKNTTLLNIHGKMKTKRQNIFDRFKSLSKGVLMCTDVMARGIDIPDVHWVIQYDPPRTSSVFIHRCGRTARMGNAGSALMFLLPTEDAYLKFLELNQKVTLEKADPPEIINNILPKVKKMALKDRAVFEKGMKAFVSYVQAYKKHECFLLFRMKDLDFAKVATGFALLRLPSMPELIGLNVVGFERSDANFNAIPYKDKQREKLRQVKLKEFQETGKWPRKEKQQKKQKPAPVKEKSKRGKKRKQDFSAEELEELARDSRLVKKLKSKKISNDEFDKEFFRRNKSAEDNDDDDDDSDL